MSTTFFVYGTLMSGEAAADMLDSVPDVRRQPAEVVRTGSVLCLPGHEGYPAVVQYIQERPGQNEELSRFRQGLEHTGYSEVIRGEIVIVPSEHAEQVLAALDRYEGYPHLYSRCRVVAYVNDGDRREAIMYYMPYNHDRMQNFSVIESGHWCEREDTIPFSEILDNGLPAQPRPAGDMHEVIRRMRGQAAEYRVIDEPMLDEYEEGDEDDEEAMNF